MVVYDWLDVKHWSVLDRYWYDAESQMIAGLGGLAKGYEAGQLSNTVHIDVY